MQGLHPARHVEEFAVNQGQLMGQHLRLKRELSMAHRTLPLNNGRINRLIVDLASSEQAIKDVRACPQRAGDAARPMA